LGKLFTVLTPVGNIAYRVNLMSAFWASAAAALFFLLTFKLTGSIAASSEELSLFSMTCGQL
jgi:hypothetical protein